jgi:hypothetical protein
MAKKIIVRTGGTVPQSGEYRPAGSRYEVTLVKGKRVPPNNEGTQQRFTLVHKAKHEKKK